MTIVSRLVLKSCPIFPGAVYLIMTSVVRILKQVNFSERWYWIPMESTIYIDLIVTYFTH